MLAPGPRPTAPGRGREFRPWNAHPVAVNTTQPPTANTRRAAMRAIIVVAHLLAAACPTRPRPAVAVAPPSESRVGAAAASPRPVSAPAAPPPAVPPDHPAGRCRPTPQAGSRAL